MEATTPLLYKRRKVLRSDIAPVEAWRIMMALRSGLLAESCWALDVLNILLFDDLSIQYFSLNNLPGLLDIILEHFSRTLTNMLDSKQTYGNQLANQTKDFAIDLGAVTSPFDSNKHVKLFSSSNFTFQTRRGKPVKTIPKDDEIFILDSHRHWDYPVIELCTEPWQIDSYSIKYIISCFDNGTDNWDADDILNSNYVYPSTDLKKAQSLSPLKREEVFNSSDIFSFDCEFSNTRSLVEKYPKYQCIEKKKKMKGVKL